MSKANFGIALVMNSIMNSKVNEILYDGMTITPDGKTIGFLDFG